MRRRAATTWLISLSVALALLAIIARQHGNQKLSIVASNELWARLSSEVGITRQSVTRNVLDEIEAFNWRIPETQLKDRMFKAYCIDTYGRELRIERTSGSQNIDQQPSAETLKYVTAYKRASQIVASCLAVALDLHEDAAESRRAANFLFTVAASMLVLGIATSINNGRYSTVASALKPVIPGACAAAISLGAQWDRVEDGSFGPILMSAGIGVLVSWIAWIATRKTRVS